MRAGAFRTSQRPLASCIHCHALGTSHASGAHACTLNTRATFIARELAGNQRCLQPSCTQHTSEAAQNCNPYSFQDTAGAQALHAGDPEETLGSPALPDQHPAQFACGCGPWSGMPALETQPRQTRAHLCHPSLCRLDGQRCRPRASPCCLHHAQRLRRSHPSRLCLRRPQATQQRVGTENTVLCSSCRNRSRSIGWCC